MTKMLIRRQVLIKYLTESYNTVQQRYNYSSDITSNINFIQLETSGNLPEDWLTANITPIFKKGIPRSSSLNCTTINLTHSSNYVVKSWSTSSIMEHLLQY